MVNLSLLMSGSTVDRSGHGEDSVKFPWRIGHRAIAAGAPDGPDWCAEHERTRGSARQKKPNEPDGGRGGRAAVQRPPA
jgi:hypothetical protein